MGCAGGNGLGALIGGEMAHVAWVVFYSADYLRDIEKGLRKLG